MVLRVLIIENSRQLTGAFRSIFNAVRLIGKVDFRFCIPKNSTTEVYLENEGINYIRIPFVEIQRNLSLILYLPTLLINSVRLMIYIRREKINIVHVNDLYNMCGVIIKVLCPSIRLVYHVRLMPGSYVKPMYDFWMSAVMRYADHIICVSKVVATHWPKTNKITVIYDAIYADESVQNIQTPAGISFLYIANYIPGKGHDHAIRALHKVIQHRKDCYLVVAGDDMGLKKNRLYKESLAALARNLNVADHVIFKDFVSDVESEMKNAMIFLNFSESESFSMTCLEALYYGTPVIATECGGPSEVIEDGVSGLLVPNKNIEAMANAMIKLASDEKLRTAFTSAGKIRAQSVFNAYLQSQSLYNVYVS